MPGSARLAELFGRRRFSIKPGLERIAALLERHQHPEHTFAAVHVVGTNGKGSTASMLASILNQAGFTTGLFTSPHLIRYNERFQVNGTAIPDGELNQLTAALLDTAADEETFFELTTALACCWFAERSVQIAILEAGMGGRSDATAALPGIGTIITPISLDHCQWLGQRLDTIAEEKIGIAKPGSPIISAHQQAEALQVIKRYCHKNSNQLLLEGRDFCAEVSAAGSLSYHSATASYDDLTLGLPGNYQTGNAAIVLAAIEQLASCGFPADSTAVRNGLAAASWPGRMERICLPEGLELLLDGAHNPDGARALSEELDEIPHRRVLLLLGMMEDKQLDGILQPLLRRCNQVVTVMPQQERALNDALLAAACRKYGVTAQAAGPIADGLAMLRRLAQPDDLLVAAGSLFLIGELKALLAGIPCEAVRG